MQTVDNSRPLVIDGLMVANRTRDVLLELRDAGIACVHQTVAVWEGSADAVRNINTYRAFLAENADVAVNVVDAVGIARARAEGRVGVLLGFQNTSPLDGDLDMVSLFYDLGIRVMQLTYNNQTLVAGGCYEPSDSGVTRFGREVIREMNAVGMLIDLSHVGDRSSLEAISLSERPVAITHANPKWFHDVPRNKSDEVLRALAANDGVLGVCPYALMLPGSGFDRPESTCSLEEFCAMIARVALDLGVEHVALGSDLALDQPLGFFQWLRMGRWTREVSPLQPPILPVWARRAADVVAIIDGLESVGFSQDEIEAISGGNWLRLFDGSFKPRGRRLGEPSPLAVTQQ